ncbi:MAG: ABC transporter permease [Rubrivivax sp.]
MLTAAAPEGPRWRDLARLTWREWQHHPWRHATAALAVALGVALASGVHWINRSALAEFGAALRSTQGTPDLVLRADGGRLPDTLFERASMTDGVLGASPVLELDTYAQAADGSRQPLRVLGVDALRLAPTAPTLRLLPARAESPLAVLDPGAVFINATARARFGLADGSTLVLQAGDAWQSLRVAGAVATPGAPLAVLDLAGAQTLFERVGCLSRIDLRLAPGADAAAVVTALALPAGVHAKPPGDAEERATQLSRAYRVNLTVLALVALFVGAFLVYSVVALSVAQRTPGFALLGVLGLGAADRRRLVLGECAVIGAAGSVLGLALGAALAAGALRWLAGDLGGGYFPGIAPSLHVDAASLLGFGVLGTTSAMVGGWGPARRAQALAPAQALKGLGAPDAHAVRTAPALALLAAGVGLAFLPPIGGLPLGAYAAVACLLFGGVALVPAAVGTLLAAWPAPAGALPRLALRRAHWQRHTATATVAGVVASLALSTALTVMVASFRDGVAVWLDRVLPADLYVRSAGSSAAADQAWLAPAWIAAVTQLPGVARTVPGRVRALSLDPARPAVALIARPIGADPDATLPLLAPAEPLARLPPGEVGIFVSEAVVALYGAAPGSSLELPLAGRRVRAHVRGVWRDYARQFGAITIDATDYRRLTGDTRVNDLALWLAPGADAAAVQRAMRERAADPALIEIWSASQIRALSLRIFDRSFAVTRLLQVIAIGVGLVGVAAALSAQVMARRKEFGLLAHLGLTRREVTWLVAGEAGAWLAVGCAVGLALGLAISVVLVHVVNPQSFHWTMPLVLPVGALAALVAAVAAAGVATAVLAARRAAALPAVRSVQEDW